MSGFWMFRRIRNDDRGAQAVEFALIWVFALVPLILGMIEFGAVMYSQITITQAAREAARQLALDVGTQTPNSCDSFCLAHAEATATSAASPLSITFSPSPVVCTAGATQGASATVTIRATTLLPLLLSVTVTGTASMPCGG